MFRRLLIAGSVGLALQGLTWAHAAVEGNVGLEGQRAELQNLKVQCAEIEQLFKAESEVCAQRFFVNACLDQAKDKRRAALRPLQERELEIEAKERRARADAQAVRVAEREREFAAADARQRTTELLQPAALPPVLNVKPASSSATSHKALSLQQTEQIKSAKSAKAAEEARRRQQQKQDYQREQALRQAQAVEKRAQNEAKLKGKKPPSQLPIPSSAEIEAAGSAASATQR